MQAVLSTPAASAANLRPRRLGARPLAPGPCRLWLGRPAVAAAATYKVTFKFPEGGEQTVECPDDTYILDAAEEAGIDIPYACRGGTCSACAVKVLEGSVDQSEQTYLDEGEMNAGFALICSSYPTSDVVLLTHQEGAVADYAMDEMQKEVKAKST
ncbi:hypothetical protein ABPG75_010531 [Micractinium tetrahymenae]